MRLRTRFLASAAVLSAALLVACGGGGSETQAPEPGVVELRPTSFQPQTIEIGRGDTVTWRWREKITHNIQGDGGIDKKNADSGSYTRTFEEAGRFGYKCTIHPGMTGTVVVE